MAAKHLILIHGRSTKPRREEKQRLVREALVAGLRRVDPKVAAKVDGGAVKTTFVYYGDVNNRLMVEAEPERKGWMVKGQDGVWYEKDGSYDADLAKLLARETKAHGKADYRKLVKEVEDQRALDDLFRVASPLLSVFGLSEKAVRKLLPDLGAYITSRVVGSEVRERLQGPLAKALEAGDDVAVVAHSMGCIVSYDVLWKFSRMSEYKHLRDRRVPLWMTLGNPLGEPAVKGNLYDSNEPEDGRYPANIDHWLNISAHDDFVAHDGNVANDFAEMRKRKLVGKIEDAPRIYTFWSGRDGSNPHKFHGYLNHPYVAKRLAEWIAK